MTDMTPWFPKEVPPHHPGVYQADWIKPNKSASYFWYAYYDGKVWGWLDLSVEKAEREYFANPNRRHPRLVWRGLANKPT